MTGFFFLAIWIAAEISTLFSIYIFAFSFKEAWLLISWARSEAIWREVWKKNSRQVQWFIFQFAMLCCRKWRRAHYKRNFPFEKLKLKKKTTHSEVSGEPVAVRSCHAVLVPGVGERRVRSERRGSFGPPNRTFTVQDREGGCCTLAVTCSSNHTQV